MNTQPMNSSNGPSRFSGPNPNKPRLKDTFAKYDRDNARRDQEIDELRNKVFDLQQQIDTISASRDRRKLREMGLTNWVWNIQQHVFGLTARVTSIEQSIENPLHVSEQPRGAFPVQHIPSVPQINPSGHGFIPQGANPNGGGTILAHLE